MGELGVDAGIVGTEIDASACETADAAKRLPALRRWESARPNDRLSGAGLVARSEVRADRAGRRYVAMTILGADAKSLEGRWWQFPDADEERPIVGSVYHFTGTADFYNGACQLAVRSAEWLPDADLQPFVRAARRPVDELQAELDARIAELDPDLAALVREVLAGEVYERFCTWPAARRHHGAVRHGLLDHSLRVAALAWRIAAAYSPDVPLCDMDLVQAACLLHDVGKVRTLPPIAGGAIPETGEMLDHVTLGVLMIRAAAERAEPAMEADRLERLLHAILAHHGQKEWGAAVEPHTAEAWLVHLADLAESRLWAWFEDAREP